MVVGSQNVYGVAVGGLEGYFGNYRFFYHANRMVSHHYISSFGNLDSCPTSYWLNVIVMDYILSSHQFLPQLRQPKSRADFTYTTCYLLVCVCVFECVCVCMLWLIFFLFFSGENNRRFRDISRNFGFQNIGRNL